MLAQHLRWIQDCGDELAMRRFDDKTTAYPCRDRHGFDWYVIRTDELTMVHWRAVSRHFNGEGDAKVKVRAIGSLQTLQMACLMDVQVDRWVENRGVGSMLVRAAIEDCKRQGNLGIYGEISKVDEDHFSKLKHFYEKLGFTFVLYDENELDENSNTVGKIELHFL